MEKNLGFYKVLKSYKMAGEHGRQEPHESC